MITPLLFAAVTQAMTLSADRIAVDNVTRSAVATGHVHAAIGVVTVRSPSASRTADGMVSFADPTYVTTCTNEIGHTHWNVTGEVEYKEHDYVILRNCWLKLWEVPVFWLPYLWYPLETDCGFTWMPGWTDQWGAYLLTRTSYNIVGDPKAEGEGVWLRGATRADFRVEQGLALGEDLKWNLNALGKGHFKVYYAWDKSDDYDENGIYDDDFNYRNWGSNVPSERYGMELFHRWDATERDIVRVKGSYYSDSYFRDDFERDSLFTIRNPWLGNTGNEVAWEHAENVWGAGLSVSGPLNDFYAGTARLPELYADLLPRPLFGLPVNYESENRVGYLYRQAGVNGQGNWRNPYAYNPGPWARYDTFRMDTYHRLSAPFRTCGDVISVVPRVAYRGTAWHSSGGTDLYGYDTATLGESGNPMYRSILEGGVTFAARGTGSVGDGWQHMLEPYADVLAQKAWYSGAAGGNRPYVFDNLDASTIWEDQFAGRGRNLPYTYYGVTPGLRNAWSKLDENGSLRTVFDVDAYAALQFNTTDWYEQRDAYGVLGDPDMHRLATPGDPNYGENGCTAVPGFRMRWFPDETVTLLARAEYDVEDNKVALADVGWQQKVSAKFKYYAKYSLRDYRWWDFSSTPYTLDRRAVHMDSDELNACHIHLANAGFEQQVCDWLAWSPFVRWDLRENELDRVGTWVDYLTDCLGFRLIVAYDNAYTAMDGYEHRERFHVGFMIYLRVFGADSSNIFNN